jgi:hypothetical protein
VLPATRAPCTLDAATRITPSAERVRPVMKVRAGVGQLQRHSYKSCY